MSRSTGPIVATGLIAWSNQVLLSDQPSDGNDKFVETAKIGVSTGVLALAFYGLEKLSPEVAVGLAWVGLTTLLFVRFNNKPTPLERIVDMIGD